LPSVGQASTIEPPLSARRATTPRLSSKSEKALQELSGLEVDVHTRLRHVCEARAETNNNWTLGVRPNPLFK